MPAMYKVFRKDVGFKLLTDAIIKNGRMAARFVKFPDLNDMLPLSNAGAPIRYSSTAMPTWSSYYNECKNFLKK